VALFAAAKGYFRLARFSTWIEEAIATAYGCPPWM
jgi:hypothetical protein